MITFRFRLHNNNCVCLISTQTNYPGICLNVTTQMVFVHQPNAYKFLYFIVHSNIYLLKYICFQNDARDVKGNVLNFVLLPILWIQTCVWRLQSDFVTNICIKKIGCLLSTLNEYLISFNRIGVQLVKWSLKHTHEKTKWKPKTLTHKINFYYKRSKYN